MPIPEKQTIFRSRLYWLLIVAVNVSSALTAIWMYRSGQAEAMPAMFGGGTGLLIGNPLILWMFYKRQTQSGETLAKSKILGCIVLGILSFAAIGIAVRSIPHQVEDIDLALSDVPLNSIDPMQKRLLVQLIRAQAANSKENDKLLAEVRKTPLNPPLYSADSFANASVMKSTADRMTYIVNADLAYSAKQEEAMQNFRLAMAKVDPDFLKKWDGSEAKDEAAIQNVVGIERELLASIQGLYSYAEDHASQIVVKDGAIKISQSDVLAEFNRQFSLSTAINDNLQKTEAGLVKHHDEAKSKIVLP